MIDVEIRRARKLKKFFNKNLKLITKILLALLVIAGLTLATFLILRAFDVIHYDDGLKLNEEIFHSFKNSCYGWVIILLFQLIITLFLCFVPGVSMAFILLLQSIYEKPCQAFLLAFIGVMLSSFIMYIVGRFGGYKVCKKLLGEKDCDKACELLNNKGLAYFPLMMMFPIFPDDALVMIAGTLKMSLKWFIPSIVLGRGIGIATIVFGISIVPFDKFTSFWHWVAFIAVCAVLIVLVFYLAYRFNSFLEKRNGKSTAEKSDAE